MSRIVLNPPDSSHRPPNTGDGTEFGDSFQSVITNLNTMMADIYGGRSMPDQILSTLNATVGTLAAGIITGASSVDVLSTNATPGTQTTRTAAQMFADFAPLPIAAGFAYALRITNSGGSGTLTLAAGAGVTLGSGTYTVPNATFRDFVVTFPTPTTCTIQTVGVGTWT